MSPLATACEGWQRAHTQGWVKLARQRFLGCGRRVVQALESEGGTICPSAPLLDGTTASLLISMLVLPVWQHPPSVPLSLHCRRCQASHAPHRLGCRPHLQGGLGQRLHAHKPLLTHQRLHNLAAALAAGHAHLQAGGPAGHQAGAAASEARARTRARAAGLAAAAFKVAQHVKTWADARLRPRVRWLGARRPTSAGDPQAGSRLLQTPACATCLVGLLLDHQALLLHVRPQLLASCGRRGGGGSAAQE